MMHLMALEGPGPAPAEVPIPLCAAGAALTVRLRCLPGASGLHLVVRRGEEVLLRAEVAADAGETVAVNLELDDEGAVHAWCPGRPTLLLPPDERFGPPPPIPAPTGARPLDLAIVLDGTLLAFPPEEQGGNPSPEGGAPLLARPRLVTHLLGKGEVAKPHFERLTELVAAMRPDDGPARIAVVAFGDLAPPGVTSGDLMPAYPLYPKEPALSRQTPEQLLVELLAAPPTAGGDFVDALADALAACRRLRWRPEARKLVVITGNSPGHSLVHPAPKGADCRARELDVDVEAMRLHKAGIEILTIFHELPADSGLGELHFQRELIDHARAQYRRLASLPALTWTATDFDPGRAAERLLQRLELVGRGATWGELLAVAPTNEISG